MWLPELLPTNGEHLEMRLENDMETGVMKWVVGTIM